jgi:serine/threonine protein phosphatase PrpC
MRTVNAHTAAGLTDPGRQRNVNEDRFHCDAARGLFFVIDGVGGQAAGGKAADVALSMLRQRLDRETGPTAERVRDAITIANNEIYRLAQTRSQWRGMACVLTVALIDNGTATIGHVGDTRFYKLRNNRIEKITRDHSPVGEREDLKQLSELEAMRHPRRNEVYRDVGSEHHDPHDSEFIDIEEIPFETDAALLLCSDGLSDLVDSATIADIVSQYAGEPEAVVRTLIETANAAGGKDNVTVVYVEGERFAASQIRRRDRRNGPPVAVATTTASDWTRHLQTVIVGTILLIVGLAIGRSDTWLPLLQPSSGPPAPATDIQVVHDTESINSAIERAIPGSQVIVEPGEYRERVFLKNGVRLVSRAPRGATLRLPSTASDADFQAAVVAADVSNAELTGFKIVGDAATPLGVGIGITRSELTVTDVEITGATRAGIDFGEGGSATLVGSDIRDNPGAAIIIGSGANPRITNNVFSRNGMSERSSGSIVIEKGSAPVFRGNVFLGISAEMFVALDEAARVALKELNWFLPLRESVRPRQSTAGQRQSTP